MAKVTVYSNLHNRQIEFEEFLLDTKPEKIQAYLDKRSNQGVPHTYVMSDNCAEKTILDFDEVWVGQTLGPAASSALE